MKLLNNDIIFKNVFNDEEIMKRLIKEALGLEVSKIEQLNTELEVSNIKEKRKILDIIAYTDKGIINVEVNNGFSKGSFNRNLLYYCKLLGSSIKKNNNYIDIVSHVQLNLTWNLDKYIERDTSHDNRYEFNVTENKLGFSIYQDLFKLIIINMDYYKDKCYNEHDWNGRFFKVLSASSIEEMKEFSRGDKIMEKITKKVEDLNVDYNIIKELEIEDDYIKLYNSDILEAHNSGVEEGIGVGEKVKARQVALNLLNSGIEIDIIEKATGLSKEEINNL